MSEEKNNRRIEPWLELHVRREWDELVPPGDRDDQRLLRGLKTREKDQEGRTSYGEEGSKEKKESSMRRSDEMVKKEWRIK